MRFSNKYSCTQITEECRKAENNLYANESLRTKVTYFVYIDLDKYMNANLIY